MTIYKYTVLFEPIEEGGYNVVIPAIPEICTFGETLEEAREMAKDASQKPSRSGSVLKCFPSYVLYSCLKTPRSCTCS